MSIKFWRRRSFVTYALAGVAVAACVTIALRAPARVWVSQNWGAVAAIGAFLQAVGVLAALAYAGGQLKETRDARRERDRPFVVVSFNTEFIERFVHLEVLNLGSTLAKNVSFEFTPPLASAQEVSGKLAKEFCASTLLDRGFKTLVPGARIRTVFDFLPDRKDAIDSGTKVPEMYDVIVRYEGPDGHRWETEYTLDLGYTRGVTYIGRRNIHHAVEELVALRKLVAKVVDVDGLRVAWPEPDEDNA